VFRKYAPPLAATVAGALALAACGGTAAGGAYANGQFSRAAGAARQGTKYKPAVQAANDQCVAMGA
jgi:hypothetical protein